MKKLPADKYKIFDEDGIEIGIYPRWMLLVSKYPVNLGDDVRQKQKVERREIAIDRAINKEGIDRDDEELPVRRERPKRETFLSNYALEKMGIK